MEPLAALVAWFSRYLPGFLGASAIALGVALAAVLLSWALGVLTMLARGSRSGALRRIAGFYVWFVRGTPSLIQVFIVYFGLPQLGLRLPPLVAGVVALGIGSGAYVAEVIRSGLQAIPRGQHDAAAALGLRPLVAFRLVILPQVVRIIVPSLTNEAINTLKNTSLLSAITVVELTLYTQTLIAATFRPFEFYILAAALYLAMTTLLESFARWYERRYQLIL